MTRAAFLSLLLLMAPMATRADTLKSEADLKAFAERVMASLVNSGMPAAFAVMKPYTVISDAEFRSAVTASQAQREQFGARYGKSVGYEFISQRKIGQSLVRVICIEKTERHALPWVFNFYLTRSGWVLNSFLWNDQWSKLFEMER